ncbi:hypothetical protein BC830DRAFT_298736 [Chytriomyces sp. MP71]|nr:hypothetical protein BC830DRAFT_298736 [Chytriomyces sp. MP71]
MAPSPLESFAIAYIACSPSATLLSPALGTCRTFAANSVRRRHHQTAEPRSSASAASSASAPLCASASTSGAETSSARHSATTATLYLCGSRRGRSSVRVSVAGMAMTAFLDNMSVSLCARPRFPQWISTAWPRCFAIHPSRCFNRHSSSVVYLSAVVGHLFTP